MKISQTMIDYAPRGQLRELHKVTQWKDGCVYRTKPLGYIVCSSDNQPINWNKHKEAIIGSISTTVSRAIIERF